MKLTLAERTHDVTGQQFEDLASAIDMAGAGDMVLFALAKEPAIPPEPPQGDAGLLIADDVSFVWLEAESEQLVALAAAVKADSDIDLH